MPDYILSLLKIKEDQPTFSRWTAHHKILMLLGCGLPISFHTSISILPYHESLPVPQVVLPHLFGWNCFRVFPQFEGFAVLIIRLGKGLLHLFWSYFFAPSITLLLFVTLFW